MTKLGLGACLADDMGLGKTIQMIALLLHEHEAHKPDEVGRKPSLLVVPASLIANWKSELQRFAPSLSMRSRASFGTTKLRCHEPRRGT